MKITAIFALTVVCVTATVVDLAPATADITPLEKRDTEILYLANCLSAVSCCTPEKDWSEMIVRPTHSSESGRDAVGLSTDTPCSDVPGSGYTSWEGNQKSCTFSTGATFTEAIDSDAQSLADFSYAGWGWNGKTWNCYKDNQRWIFDPEQPEAINGCKSVYYCLPA
ncbi:hypothetical protein B0H14DRAFT_2342969 [Mycena olivaceomarginata]|nr:hypothetical protein B0H14DRAFT_2342969 [Mycena olivaceomarginata]